MSMVALWLGRGLAGLICLVWAGGLVRAVRSRKRRQFHIDAETAGPPAGTRVTVVIPARDEVSNIGPCVRAVLAQDLPEVRVVVLDDGSSDGTGDVLAELVAVSDGRLTVVPGGDSPLPAGWVGKPWACQRAADAALAADPSPEWLLFLDADVRLDPHALRAAVGYAAANELDMLSGFGRLELRTFAEKMMQPIVAGMILAGNPLSRVNDPERRGPRPIANGQFILLRREAHAAVGGHSAVRDDVLDDVGMATAVTKAGLAYNLVFMTTCFSVRMYESFADLWEGWTKNLFAGLGRSWAGVFALCLGTIVGVLGPYILLAVGLAGVGGVEAVAWGALGVSLIQGLRLYLDAVFDQSKRYGLTHAPGSALLVVLVLRSAIRSTRGTASWKGRTLPAGPPSAGT